VGSGEASWWMIGEGRREMYMKMSHVGEMETGWDGMDVVITYIEGIVELLKGRELS
jgi:hypothetical protein